MLKRFHLVESPGFQLVTAVDRFAHPTRRVNKQWQTDFTFFKIQGWGLCYLSPVLDDYSRYILTWKLSATMAATDVQVTFELALARARLDRVRVRHRPWLLSDNGPCCLSGELRRFLECRQMEDTRGAPYHPMTQGKIERYHRSMDNLVQLQNYAYPCAYSGDVVHPFQLMPSTCSTACRPLVPKHVVHCSHL